MKPDWDKLMDSFKDSTTALVGDVDCTAGGQSLCSKVGVEGYPTIKHGDPADLKNYEGGRTLDDLKKFAEENLGPTCGPDHLELCNEEDKALIEKFQKMDLAELDTKVDEADATMKKIEEKSKKAVSKIEAKIEEVTAKVAAETKKKEDAIAKEQKKQGLGMMKAVAAKKRKDEL